jgi:hypothetical protein
VSVMERVDFVMKGGIVVKEKAQFSGN